MIGAMAKDLALKTKIALTISFLWTAGVFLAFVASHNATQHEWMVSASACTLSAVSDAPRSFTYQCGDRQYPLRPSDDWPNEWAADQHDRLAAIWCPSSPTLVVRPWCAVTSRPISLHQ